MISQEESYSIDNKYYCPCIEEFFYGYECERFGRGEYAPTGEGPPDEKYGRWTKYVIDHNDKYGNGLEIPPINHNTRTAYLTREDIVEEGFPFLESNGLTDWFGVQAYKIPWNDQVQDYFGYKPYYFQILYCKDNNKLKINIDFTADNTFDTMYEGECKSLSEFRRILNQLKIKEWK